MFRFSRVVLLVSAAAAMTATSALAVSNAHFVGSPTIERAGNTLITSGKVAGLGDVQTITVSVTGDAYCINPGSNRPKDSLLREPRNATDRPHCQELELSVKRVQRHRPRLAVARPNPSRR